MTVARSMLATVGLCLALSAVCEPLRADPVPRRRIYIGLDDHTDYVWNSSEAANRQSFLDMLDYYLDLKDSTLGNPSDFQSRFNCDVSLMARVYEEERTPAQFARLMEGVRSGHITIPLNTLVNTYGGTPTEAVVRGMYYAGTLERRFDLRLPLALSMENQTLPWGLSSLWAGSGAKYSWRGVCGCVTRTPFAGTREHEVFWYTGPDGQRVLMKWYSAANSAPDSSIGGYAEARFLNQAVDYVTVDAPNNGFNARYPFDVVGVFGYGWDNLGAITNSFVTQAPVLSNASRRVIVSNQIDFFEDFLQTHPNQIPSVNYSYGNEWDLYQCSLPELTARARRSMDKARPAEAMATLVSLAEPGFMSGRELARTKFNIALGMYWEHDWTGDGGFGAEREVIQRRLVGDMESYINTLHADASAAIARLIAPAPRAADAPAGSLQFFVFNPLGFARSDAADIPWNASGPVSVFDLSDQTLGPIEVPSQIVTIDGVRTLRLWASDVPSVGYKVFEARPVAGQSFSQAATVTTPVSGAQTVTATYVINADNRDAHSLNSGGPDKEVRISGYAEDNRHDYWGADFEAQTTGLQFSIDVPRGAVVTDARLVLTTATNSSPSATGGMRIRAYDLDNTPAFTAGFDGDLAARFPLAPGEVIWAAPTWPDGSTQTSPNLATIVQGFVSRSGYVPGNYIGLVIDANTIAPDSYYGCEDFAKPNGQPARLVVTYQSAGSGAPSNDRVLENETYRVRLTPRGAVASVIDKARGNREFAGFIGGRAVNDLGGGAAADGTGSIAIENAGPVSVTLVATSTLPLAHTTRLTLYRGGDRIALHNRITQDFSFIQDWSFAFNLTAPRVRHEEVGAIATAALRTQGGSYATQNARYDWLTFNNFADMDDTSANGGGVGVTLANIDVPFFRLGNSNPSTLDTSTPSINPVAGGRLDGPTLGLPNLGGDSVFTQRFALRTRGPSSSPESMRFALEFAHPLVTGLLTPSAGAQPLPARRYSLVSVDNPGVLLWVLKPAEDGPNAPGGPITARFWNLQDTPTVANALINFPNRRLSSAVSATHIETIDASILPNPTTQANAIRVDFAPQQLRTIRVGIRCTADFDNNGDRAIEDIFAFLNAWFAGSIAADFDGVDGVAINDIFAFLNAWFAGC